MTSREAHTFVVVSTAHLTAQTARHLDNTPAKEWPCVGGPYGDYGWFVYAMKKMPTPVRTASPRICSPS